MVPLAKNRFIRNTAYYQQVKNLKECRRYHRGNQTLTFLHSLRLHGTSKTKYIFWKSKMQAKSSNDRTRFDQRDPWEYLQPATFNQTHMVR